MAGIDEVMGEIRQECAAEFERRLRERLRQQPTDWLVDQLMARIGRTLPAEWLPSNGPDPVDARGSGYASGALAVVGGVGRPSGADAAGAAREAGTTRKEGTSQEADAIEPGRVTRRRAVCVDEACVRGFIDRCRPLTRERLERDEYLVDPPMKGSPQIASGCRTAKGEALLREAKELLDALLFGAPESGVPLARVQRELLTITVARAKADTIAALLRAATEIDAEGTWRDPEHVANDDRAPNTLLEVEYGEVASEMVGRGIALALRLINDLEINEQVLYARMANVEESSLAS